MSNYGTSQSTEGQSDLDLNLNPIVEVNLQATQEDGFYFQNNLQEQYIGPYHRHEDGTLMIGAGQLGVVHDMIPDEIIIRKVTYQFIQETREAVSDIFYKLWFESNTLTDDQLLSLQTTIRDGIKQSGRTEEEPLVFYKKDRNTLENRKDIQSDTFEQMCQYIFDNDIVVLEDKFSITETQYPPTTDGGESVTQYQITFNHSDNVEYAINIARKVGNQFTDILNLSQLTKTKTSSKIDPEKAREVLDTNIFELLPTQPNRQEEINNFFVNFDSLIGPTPLFEDIDGDGVGEFIPDGGAADSGSRISEGNVPTAFITRLDEQANEDNNNKTLQSMRNKLNTYLGDVDNVVDTLNDDRPEYENISNGFLKIRKPNQAIILKTPTNGELEFQKNNSYLTDGFTITMWVRFVDKQSSGTLFNFGNPLEENGRGFRLETRTSIDSGGNYRRWLRLVVKDDLVRDNHFGDTNAKRRPASLSSPLDFYAERNFHKLYPNIPTDNLNEWYFICATYNPQVVEVANLADDNPLLTDKQYWLNHKIYYNTLDTTSEVFIPVGNRNDIVANSLEGARCKVEIISRSDLLRARGFKVDDLTVDAPTVDGLEEDEDSLIGENGDGNGVGEEEGNNDIVPSVSDGDDVTNPSNEQSSEEETQEESSEEETQEETDESNETDPRDILPDSDVDIDIPDDIINFGAGGGRY